ncbi:MULTISPECIES: competence pheromone ComX [Priestia]|uniref:competence pheromone ComX n=1 Tax=Priestia TaxID=2800373 RepID=UPI001ADC7E06|nr:MULTISPECIES: competence pheromone ComX [Priestia]QTL52732.1 competence pheromone ComX [Priestia aryabhattai]USL45321.1 competence pheromone ComX [Priestia megaterium]
MKELLYYLSENPDILELVKEGKASLIFNSDLGIKVETIIDILINNSVDITASYWK